MLVGSGWAQEVVADRATLRTAAPRVTALNETGNQLARDPDQGAARLPAVAFEAARAALAAGRPVLVQVPRAGYLPWLACAQCRETARCRHCAGPLALPGGARASADGQAVRRWRGCRSAAGAGGPSRRSAARRARRVGCGPGSSAPGAPRRSWAAPSPGRRCAPRAAVRRSSTACPPGPTWWSPRPAPNRPRRAGTGRRCCSTGGRCCRARTCGWRRRRCGAGWRRRRWWCRPPTGAGWAGWSWSRTRRCRRCRRWCAGTRPGTRPPSWPRARRSGSRPRCGWRRSRARHRPSPRSSTPRPGLGRGGGPRPAGRRGARTGRAGSRAGRRPRRRAPGTRPACACPARRAARWRRRWRPWRPSARRARRPDPVRVRLDPPEVG